MARGIAEVAKEIRQLDKAHEPGVLSKGTCRAGKETLAAEMDRIGFAKSRAALDGTATRETRKAGRAACAIGSAEHEPGARYVHPGAAVTAFVKAVVLQAISGLQQTVGRSWRMHRLIIALGLTVIVSLGCAGLEEPVQLPERDCLDANQPLKIIFYAQSGSATDQYVGCVMTSAPLLAELYTSDGWLVAKAGDNYAMVDAGVERFPTGVYIDKRRVQFLGMDFMTRENGNREVVPYFRLLPQ